MDGDLKAPMPPKEAGEKAQAEALVKQFLGLWKRNSTVWREEARTSFKFYAGEQWSVDDRAFLEEQLRPVVTFNRVAPFIDAIVGQAINQRTRISYLPRRPEGTDAARALSEIARWLLEKSPANEESRAFRDALLCGIGWLSITMDYDLNPDGEVKIERVDPFEVLFDTRANRFDDMRFVARERWTDRDEAKDLFGDQVAALLPDNDDPLDETTRPLDANKMWKYQESFTAPSEKHVGKIRVIEWQYWRREDAYFLITPQGLQETPKTRLLEDMEEGRDYIKQSKKVFYRAFSIGDRVMEVGRNPFPNGFTLIPVLGKHDLDQNIFYGLMRTMKHPQEWANKFFSQLQMIINSNAKGGLYAELDAFDNVRKAESEFALPNSITWLRPNGLQKIRDKVPAPIPQGITELLQFSINALRDTTGVNLEFLGMATREQAQSLELERKRGAMNILAEFFDNLKIAKGAVGRVLLYFIRHYMADGRIMRLGAEKAIPLLRDTLGDSEYDVIVDESPDSPNVKAEVWAAVQPILPVLGNFNAPPEVLVNLLKYSPLPYESVEAMLKAIEESKQNQQQAEQQRAIEQAKAQAEIQALQAKAQKDQASAARAYSDAQRPAPQSAPQTPLDIAGAAAEMELKRAKAAQAKASAMKTAMESMKIMANPEGNDGTL